MIYAENDWWNAVNNNWDKLSKIVHMFVDMNEIESLVECVEGGHKKWLIPPDNRSQELVRLRDAMDKRLVQYFQEAWGKAPNNKSIHHIDGWFILCELCSEVWVLERER